MYDLAGECRSLHLSPNPAVSLGVSRFCRNSFSGTCEARILDLSGRVLANWRFQKQVGSYSQTVDIGHLAAGSYFMEVLGEGFRETQAFIKQ